MTPPEICPQCGADVPPNAKCCPECGSDEQTGWSERARYQEMGIPVDEDEFDYEEFVKEEFGEESRGQLRPRGMSWLWWGVAAVLLVLLIGWLVLSWLGPFGSKPNH